MVAIPMLSGIGATERADFERVYPTNLEPVPLENGISEGQLRSAMGATALSTGPGVDRGGIVWNELHCRVMGSKLCSVSSTGIVTQLGDVGDDGKPVSLDYGFGRLAIRSGTNLYYYDGTTLVQVTDPDLGPCYDVAWLNGQYFSTDGNYVVATQISDPTQVDPLKYGSAESDPDMVIGLLRLRDEMYILGANTIEIHNYVGGTGYPLQQSPGATIPVGCVSALAKCLFAQTFAFVGSSRNQAPSVWLAGSGSAQRLSTRAVDDFLAAQADMSSIELEARVSRGEQRLYVHLADKTLVYLMNASQIAGRPVWYVAKSGRGMNKPYRLRHATLVAGQYIVGDTESSALGVLTEGEATHFGEAVGWQFQTEFLYNQTNSAIAHQFELVGLPGRHQTTPEPAAFFSYTVDGETWSMERTNTMGRPGQRSKRVVFNSHRRFRNYIGVRFRGDSSALAGWAALDVELEPLSC